MSEAQALIPRVTVEQIVAHRDRALELYEVAFRDIERADASIRAAREAAALASPGINNYNHNHADEIRVFHGAVNLPDRDKYLRTARRLTDINVWAYIIERTDLQRLMDKEAKDQLRDQMAYIPERTNGSGQLINEEEIARGLPPVTVENILATVERFQGDAGMIFRRGIANAFSKLDRRFRSHDGFKIGSRVVLTNAFDRWGSLNWGYVQDTLIDIERVFSVLDGKPEAEFTSAIYALQQERRGMSGPRQSYVEVPFMRIRGFKNGNAHLWFTRDDLVQKVNKLLAEYYGEVIGDGQTQEDDPLNTPKTTPARFFGFYPTPPEAAARLLDGANLLRPADKPPLRILEPSAGLGNLARRCLRSIEELDKWSGGRERYAKQYRFDNKVDCVEIQPHLAEGLEREGIYNRVYSQDFLSLSPKTTGLYNLVIMNPPFDRERDIDHVAHALKFLAPDGMLCAIMSAGTEFRETRKATAFRAAIEAMKGEFRDLPAGSFSEVGTHVNTVMLRVRRDGKSPRGW